MLALSRVYFIIFGLLTIAGGVIGYLKARSIPSITAGSIAGVLLLITAFLLPEHRTSALMVALLLSLLLLVQFAPKFFRTGKVMPAGVMSLLSLLGIIVAIAAWLKG